MRDKEKVISRTWACSSETEEREMQKVILIMVSWLPLARLSRSLSGASSVYRLYARAAHQCCLCFCFLVFFLWRLSDMFLAFLLVMLHSYTGLDSTTVFNLVD
jgi:hypothetical protein